MKLESIEDVLATQLADLRSVEAQLLEALPEMVGAAADSKLTRAFTEHLAETERQATRLDEIIEGWPIEVPSRTSEAMQGLIEEVTKIIGAEATGEVRDVALVAAAQRIEHFEISAYGSARALADQLDLRSAVELLAETLAEEARADELLTKLAIGGIIVSGLNERAQD